MKLTIKKGTTSKLVNFFILDNTRGDGAGLTGILYNSTSLTAYYYREGAGSATSITLADMTIGTWASGGFKQIDATNLPGMYQLGVPNAAIASGANSVVIMLKGAQYMVPVLMEIELVDYDPASGTNLGLTALPTATAGADGGLLINERIVATVNDGSPTTSDFDGSGGLSATDDFYNGSVLVFTSGTLKGIARKITDYTGSTKNLTFAFPWPVAPTNGDAFAILGRID